jgi:hypothetical protein
MEEFNRVRFTALQAHNYGAVRQPDQAMKRLCQQMALSSFKEVNSVKKRLISCERTICTEFKETNQQWLLQFESFTNNSELRQRALTELKARYRDPVLFSKSAICHPVICLHCGAPSESSRGQ